MCNGTMTNSHNRSPTQQQSTNSGNTTTVSPNTSGRFYNNNNGQKGIYGQKMGSAKKSHNASMSLNSSGSSYRSGYGQQQQQQQQPQQQQAKVASPNGQKYFGSMTSDRYVFSPLKQHALTSTPGKTPASQSMRTSPVTSPGSCPSPPHLSHFAGSKCYDAPAPTALPKPPKHWTTTTSSSPPPSLSSASSPVKPQSEATGLNAYYATNNNNNINKSINNSNNKAKKKNRSSGVIIMKHHQQQLSASSPLGNNQMLSCSREFLLGLTNSPKSGGARGQNKMDTSRNNDYDVFSENLKMVLNVRA